MKILLDEQVHKVFKDSLKFDAEIFTVKEMGWRGLSNGFLCEKLNENQFDFLLASDKNIPFQQNIEKMNFTLILIDTPSLSAKIQTLFIPKTINFLQNLPLPLPKLVHVSHEIWRNTRLIEKLKNRFPPDQILFL